MLWGTASQLFAMTHTLWVGWGATSAAESEDAVEELVSLPSRKPASASIFSLRWLAALLLFSSLVKVAQASSFPTSQPSRQPTAVPSEQPTSQPSIYPKYIGNSIHLANLTQYQGIYIGNANTSVYAVGYSVSNAGDVNGDGWDDVLVGGYGNSQGVVYLLYGSHSPFNIDLCSLTTAQGVAFTSLGYDYIGFTLGGGGDINKDNYTDIIIGAFGYPSSNQAGRVYVVFGGKNLVDLYLPSMSSSQGFSITSPNTGKNFGYSVSGGYDFNGDGYSDIFIGVANYLYPSKANFGAAYVIYGGKNLTNINVDNLSRQQGLLIEATSGGYLPTISVSGIKDINKDGKDEIAIGAWTDNFVYIIYGCSNATTITLVNLTQAQGISINGTAYTFSGYVVASAGDFNNDGYGDVLLGQEAWARTPGVAYVIYGGKNLTNRNLNILKNTEGMEINGVRYGDLTGCAVAGVGDINADGFDDIAIGAYGYVSSQSSGKGIVYVIYGGKNVPSLNLANGLSTSYGMTFTGENQNDNAGFSVSGAGDVNKDGFADFLIGVPGHRVGKSVGVAYLIYGGMDFPTSQPSRQPSSDPSHQPTSRPSGVPTEQPTGQPTLFPSSRPSRMPTKRPTGQPTKRPYATPSAQPSKNPTSKPSRQPTKRPSSQPSRQPTNRPSVYPTVKPSTWPTNVPWSRPSSRPSHRPTTQPTLQPTTWPSSFPTSHPSLRPTLVPIVMPSGQPTFVPTLIPTRQPSRRPSTAPTAQPSHRPSQWPTSQPVSWPSSLPTSHPSLTPSVVPTRLPSGRLTFIPTVIPSRFPTLGPSHFPTEWPACLPTNNPSFQPTFSPTIMPSGQLTLVPTLIPTNIPTSLLPTLPPTQWPTNFPSPGPSYSPTWIPSFDPSNQPTWMPSWVPTKSPSRLPTVFPSTLSPSTLLPTTMIPTVHPSLVPTISPSRVPSIVPSTFPSHLPTLLPTSLPTPAPISVLGYWASYNQVLYGKEVFTRFENVDDKMFAFSTNAYWEFYLNGQFAYSQFLPCSVTSFVLINTSTIIYACMQNNLFSLFYLNRFSHQFASFGDVTLPQMNVLIFEPLINRLYVVGADANQQLTILKTDMENVVFSGNTFTASGYRLTIRTGVSIGNVTGLTGIIVAGDAIGASLQELMIFSLDADLNIRAVRILWMLSSSHNSIYTIKMLPCELGFFGCGNIVFGGMLAGRAFINYAYSPYLLGVGRGFRASGASVFTNLISINDNYFASGTLNGDILIASVNAANENSVHGFFGIRIKLSENNSATQCTLSTFNTTLTPLFLTECVTNTNESVPLIANETLDVLRLPQGYSVSQATLTYDVSFAVQSLSLTVVVWTQTRAPTILSTSLPTVALTKSPTIIPTVKLSKVPVVAPSEMPLLIGAPTGLPIIIVTNMPSEEPSESPSQAPTTEPSEAPTVFSTIASTLSSTSFSTIIQTFIQTIAETFMTNEPTAIPTKSPTFMPTLTIRRNYIPTLYPSSTSGPTSKPTNGTNNADDESNTTEETLPLWAIVLVTTLCSVVAAWILWKLYDSLKECFTKKPKDASKGSLLYKIDNKNTQSQWEAEEKDVENNVTGDQLHREGADSPAKANRSAWFEAKQDIEAKLDSSEEVDRSRWIKCK